MRIISFVDHVWPRAEGGDAIAGLTEASALGYRGHHIKVVSTHMAEGGAPVAARMRTEHAGIAVELMPPAQCAEYAEPRPDCILVNHPASFEAARALARRAGAPLLARMHVDYVDLYHVALRLELPPDRVIRWCPLDAAIAAQDRMCRGADGVIFISRHMHTVDRTDRAQYFVPPVQLSPRWHPRADRRGPPCIVLGGRISDPTKGFDRALLALTALVQWGYDFRVVVVGDTSHAQSAQLRALLGARLELHSWVTDRTRLWELIGQGDLFVSLSYYDPYGMMAIEALQLGLVPITTAIGAAADFLAPTRPNLAIDDSLDAGEVAGEAARAIAELIDDPRARARELAHCLAELDAYHRSWQTLDRVIRQHGSPAARTVEATRAG